MPKIEIELVDDEDRSAASDKLPTTPGEFSEALIAAAREAIDRDNIEYAALVDRITTERDEARATATRYMEEAEKLKASLEKWKDAERESSIAHLRIRAIVNNCSTPPGVDGYEVTERAVRQAVERAALLAPLAKIAERMDGQDNRATADPIFVVQQRRRISGIDTGWTDNVMWIYDGDRIADTREQLENFLHENDLDEDKSLESGDLIKTGYMDIFEFVQPFFSHKAADDYIEVNRHRMIDPRVYVDSAYRNKEWQAVRGVLLEMVEKGEAVR